MRKYIAYGPVPLSQESYAMFVNILNKNELYITRAGQIVGKDETFNLGEIVECQPHKYALINFTKKEIKIRTRGFRAGEHIENISKLIKILKSLSN